EHEIVALGDVRAAADGAQQRGAQGRRLVRRDGERQALEEGLELHLRREAGDADGRRRGVGRGRRGAGRRAAAGGGRGATAGRGVRGRRGGAGDRALPRADVGGLAGRARGAALVGGGAVTAGVDDRAVGAGRRERVSRAAVVGKGRQLRVDAVDVAPGG